MIFPHRIKVNNQSGPDHNLTSAMFDRKTAFFIIVSVNIELQSSAVCLMQCGPDNPVESLIFRGKTKRFG